MPYPALPWSALLPQRRIRFDGCGGCLRLGRTKKGMAGHSGQRTLSQAKLVAEAEELGGSGEKSPLFPMARGLVLDKARPSRTMHTVTARSRSTK